jgi:hypothetical protein
VVIRAGSGMGKGYLIQGIIAGIVIKKASKKSNHTPWNKIQQESKKKKKAMTP